VLKLLPGLENALEKRGVTHRTVRTEALEHAIHEAREAASEGEIPVVMSGDGLVGQVGGVLTGAEVPLGIIPGGRGNDLARVLGIPKDVEGAADVLAAGNVRRIDVGEVNGHRFVGIASCGFDSVANRIANEAELIGGNLVYLYAGLRTLATWRPARFTVTVDGRRHEFSGYTVAAANNKAYGGGMFLAPHAELDDGQLDVVLIDEIGKLRYLANLPTVFKGTHVDREGVTVLRGAEVEIEADRPFAVYADGDHLADLPARVHVLPSALGVIAPPE
jgi:YegS/Rv2252/BmrU family lipid kinase